MEHSYNSELFKFRQRMKLFRKNKNLNNQKGKGAYDEVAAYQKRLQAGDISTVISPEQYYIRPKIQKYSMIRDIRLG